MDAGSNSDGLIKVPNVPDALSMVMTSRYATLHELQTVYGTEHLYDMAEVAHVDAYNTAIMAKRSAPQ